LALPMLIERPMLLSDATGSITLKDRIVIFAEEEEEEEEEDAELVVEAGEDEDEEEEEEDEDEDVEATLGLIESRFVTVLSDDEVDGSESKVSDECLATNSGLSKKEDGLEFSMMVLTTCTAGVLTRSFSLTGPHIVSAYSPHSNSEKV
jgi:hypothetical protein